MKVCTAKKQVEAPLAGNDDLNINTTNVKFDRLYKFDIKEEEIDN